MNEAAAEAVPTVHHEAGDVIVREGETSPCLFIIEDGEVEVASGEDGDEQSLGRLGPGDFFGELSLLEALPSTETVRAASDCALLSIDRASLPYVLRENTDVALLMIRRLALRAREHQWQLLELRERVESMPGPWPVSDPKSSGDVVTEAIDLDGDNDDDDGDASDTHAYLLHPESGLHHEIDDEARTVLGRPDVDADFVPDIDLGELDAGRSTSRRHACIERRDSGWVLFETGATANGTFVNNERLSSGTEHILEDGDRLRLGVVTLSFHIR